MIHLSPPFLKDISERVFTQDEAIQGLYLASILCRELLPNGGRDSGAVDYKIPAFAGMTFRG